MPLEDAFTAISRETSGHSFTAVQLAVIANNLSVSSAALRRKLFNAGCNEPEDSRDLAAWLFAHNGETIGGMRLTGVATADRIVWTIQPDTSAQKQSPTG